MIRIVGFALFLGHFIPVAGCLADYDVAAYWTDLSGQPKTGRETSVWTTSPQIILLDSELLVEDFSETAGRTPYGQGRWLLDRGQGFISEAQTDQTRHNEKIRTDATKRLPALRPKLYGRALVYPHLEVKGAGGNPEDLETLNGLLSLQMALREYLFERIELLYLRRLLPHIVNPLVRSYAVAGLNFKLSDRQILAGNISRQLNRRVPQYTPAVREQIYEYEEALRYVGIASSSERGKSSNIQMTDDGRIVDLGTHQVIEGGFPPCFVGQRKLDVQPLVQYAVPFDLLGRNYWGTGYREYEDRSLTLTARWANGIMNATLLAPQVQREFDAIIAEIKILADRTPTLAELRRRYPQPTLEAEPEPEPEPLPAYQFYQHPIADVHFPLVAPPSMQHTAVMASFAFDLQVQTPAGAVVSDLRVAVSLGCPTLLVDFRKK